MPRPERIEYEHAFYHVMNRGRGRRRIYHDEQYYQAFLDTLESACERFTGIVHAYCLMGNHYHLLVETPLANLGRIMRHVNGVYTQQYNRLKNTDGPLFRGRYKALNVDADAYLLQLTRYIHRNPIDIKTPMVDTLSDYPWSSYPAYINQVNAPAMLERDKTYEILGHKQRYRGYAEYVHEGVDPELLKYYRHGNTATVIGDSRFRSWLHREVLPKHRAEDKVKITHADRTVAQVTHAIAKYYQQSPRSVRAVIKGPGKGNEARKLAMYLSQQVTGATLQEIAEYYNLGHRGSVSHNNHVIRARLKDESALRVRLDEIIKVL